MYYTTKGLVLREVKYKEADKLLTVLTDDMGKITVKAASAMRPRSKFSAASQLFAFSEMSIFVKYGRFYLREASCIAVFDNLRKSLAAQSLASYFVSVIEAVSDEDRAQSELLQLALNSLYALDEKLRPQSYIKAGFEIRCMCIAGFEPHASGCAVCGRDDVQDPMFSVENGFVHCEKCESGDGQKSLRMNQGSYLAMKYITSAKPSKLFSFRLEDEALANLTAISEKYLLTHLDRRFNTLDYYKEVLE